MNVPTDTDTTFTTRDLLRIYCKHLSPAEQTAVRAAFSVARERRETVCEVLARADDDSASESLVCTQLAATLRDVVDVVTHALNLVRSFRAWVIIFVLAFLIRLGLEETAGTIREFLDRIDAALQGILDTLVHAINELEELCNQLQELF